MATLVAGSLSCGQPFSNEDILFLKALPNRALVRVAVPEGEDNATSASLRAAQGADSCVDDMGNARNPSFYSDATRTGDGINAGLFGILDIVDFVTRLPPTSREDEVRVWGPFFEDGIERTVEIQRVATPMDVESVADGATIRIESFFSYELRVRRVGETAELVMFSGTFAEIGTARRGIGNLLVDFDAAAAVDPTVNERGQILMRYDTRGEGVALDIELRNCCSELEQSPQSFYRFRDDGKGTGFFEFDVFADVDNGQSSRVLQENLRIKARWVPSNQGRADVVISGGDYQTPLFASECWNSQFKLTFAEWSTADFRGVCGSVAGCAPEHQRADFPEPNGGR